MNISPNVQHIVVFAFVLIWVGGIVAFYVRMRARQGQYLKRFPPVEGVPLEIAGGGNPFGAVSRAIWRALLRRQPDPDLERLRHDIWRRFGHLVLWIYGFPLVMAGGTALLIVTGVIHVMAG